MLLSSASIGNTYSLVSCSAPFKTRNKLEILGFVPGEEIGIIQKTGAGIIVEIKNSRLAIARDVVKFLEVESSGNDGFLDVDTAADPGADPGVSMGVAAGAELGTVVSADPGVSMGAAVSTDAGAGVAAGAELGVGVGATPSTGTGADLGAATTAAAKADKSSGARFVHTLEEK